MPLHLPFIFTKAFLLSTKALINLIVVKYNEMKNEKFYECSIDFDQFNSNREMLLVELILF
jgi:hypothetical protein